MSARRSARRPYATRSLPQIAEDRRRAAWYADLNLHKADGPEDGFSRKTLHLTTTRTTS